MEEVRFYSKVSGDKSNLIQVWNAQTCQHLKTLRGHEGPVTVNIDIIFNGRNHRKS